MRFIEKAACKLSVSNGSAMPSALTIKKHLPT